MKFKSFHFIIITVLFLTACGGGSDGSGELKTGQFWDSRVKGLHYKTTTQEGTTNANGEFQYRDGEMVTFSLGDLKFNPVPAQSRITPFDLFFITPPLGGDFFKAFFDLFDNNHPADAFEHTVNLLIFLQSLDINGNPDDGIEIPGFVLNFFTTVFTAAIFEQENEVFLEAFLDLIAAILAQGNTWETSDAQPKQVDYAEALEHFYREIGKEIVIPLN